MKISFRQSASDDAIRQFRYYLLKSDSPDIAIRFRESLRLTVNLLRKRPFVGAHCGLLNRGSQDFRSWPIQGFEAIRIYYLVGKDAIEVIRILHGKRDVKRILGDEP